MIEIIGGPDRDRTDDLFHAMEARSQLRHRPTLGKDSPHSQVCGPLSQTSRVAPNHVAHTRNQTISGADPRFPLAAGTYSPPRVSKAIE